jgi:hypothetical protein
MFVTKSVVTLVNLLFENSGLVAILKWLGNVVTANGVSVAGSIF